MQASTIARAMCDKVLHVPVVPVQIEKYSGLLSGCRVEKIMQLREALVYLAGTSVSSSSAKSVAAAKGCSVPGWPERGSQGALHNIQPPPGNLCQRGHPAAAGSQRRLPRPGEPL